MKKPHVLNRPMFNTGGTSAYGKGITSNLVSDEQRQRFNYGGREGLLRGGDWWEDVDIQDTRYGVKPTDYYTGLEKQPKDWWAQYSSQTPEDPFTLEKENRAQWEQRHLPLNQRQTGAEFYAPNTEEEAIQEDIVREGGDTIVYEQDEIERARKRISGKETPLPIDTESDTLNWEEILEPTEAQKKRTKGKAQLGLAAGALDVFSRPTTAKKMQAAVPHLTKLGVTATAQEDAIDKAILQGKVLEKVYKGREQEKGKQTRKSAEEAAAIKAAPEKASDIFHSIILKRGSGSGGAKALKDEDWALALEEATGSPVDTATREDIPNIEGNANLPEVKNKTYVIEGNYYKIDSNTGRLKNIHDEILAKFKRT